MLDLLIIFLFMGWAIWAGFRAKSLASKDLGEYFLAGRSIKGWKAGLSMAATQSAADTPLLATGLIATGGVFLLWRLWIYGVAFLMMGFLFSALWRRAGVLTDAELAEVRYSGPWVLPLRILKAIYYGTVMNCVVLAMVLVAAMRIAEVFLPWHEWLPASIFGSIRAVTEWFGFEFAQGVRAVDPTIATANNVISILAILTFTALYSTTGGLRAVISTDIGQITLTLLATLIYAYVVADAAGGLGNITDSLVALYGPEGAEKHLSFWPSSWEMIVPFLVIISLQWVFQMNSDGTGYLAQRSMACRSDRDARIAALTFAWAQVFVRSILWLVIGMGILALEPLSLTEDPTSVEFAASREILFVTHVNELLPAGLRGLMMVGLLAALSSTVDSHLNWGASYWANDVYLRLISQRWRKREPGDHELVIVARLSHVMIMGVALFIMGHLGSIQEAWYLSLLFGAGMGAVLVLRWLWERINVFSEFGAMAAALVTAPALLMVTDQEWVRLGCMALISTIVVVVVTLATPTTDAQVLKRFYQRTRPIGFWGSTAVSAGEEPDKPIRDLISGLRATAFSAGSLFLMLVGVGKIIFQLPQESAWPAWVFIVLAVGLVPFWWNAVFGKDGSTDAPEG